MHDHHKHPTNSTSALTCPVMKGDSVNKEEAEKNGWVREYKGKKYYFCCGSCPEDFDKNPEQYI